MAEAEGSTPKGFACHVTSMRALGPRTALCGGGGAKALGAGIILSPFEQP